MRYILLFALILAYGLSSAQEKLKTKNTDPQKWADESAPKTVAPGTYLQTPDNMPCVVPNLATVTPMPNSVAAIKVIPFMPNGYRKMPVASGKNATIVKKVRK